MNMSDRDRKLSKVAVFFAVLLLVSVAVAAFYPKESSDTPRQANSSSEAEPIESEATDLQSEIIKNVIDPCYTHLIETGELGALLGEDKATISDALTLLKIMEKGTVENLIEVTLPEVRGLDAAEKKAVYEFALSQCLRGINEERQRQR